MEEAQVRKLADGRIYSGAQAQQLGLVDQFGTLQDAIDFAAKRAGIDTEPAIYQSRPEQERWWERMFMGIFGRRLPGPERGGWLRYEWSPALLQ